MSTKAANKFPSFVSQSEVGSIHITMESQLMQKRKLRLKYSSLPGRWDAPWTWRHAIPGTCPAHRTLNQRLCLTGKSAGVDSQRHSSSFPSPTRKTDILLGCRETSGRQPREKASYRRPSGRFLPHDLHHGQPSLSCPRSSN